MIKVYVMSTCPDCKGIKQVIGNNPEFQIIDLGEHVRNLKEFMRLRDTHPKFATARQRGLVGIPSFLKEDGTVTFKPEEVGVKKPEEKEAELQKPAEEKMEDGASCNIDGSGC